MTLIALYSPTPGCGKSTAASHLRYAHNFTVRSFATPMRLMMGALLSYAGQDASVLTCDIRKDEPMLTFPYQLTPRHLMRTLGTEWGRTCCGPRFWTDLWSDKVSQDLQSGADVACDDLRFPEEYYACKELGGQVWQITRTNAKPKSNHPSDGGLHGFKFDLTIENESNINDFRQLISSSLPPHA
jgi:hypothetical protein